MNRIKSIKRGSAMAAVLLVQSIGTAGAAGLELEGTTQFSTVEKQPGLDSFYVPLEIEEVYVEAGDSVSKGDALLKLTDDSYLEAREYYQAAIIRAENDLVQARLDYAQNSEQLEYTMDMAEAKAQLASNVRASSLKELTDTISSHETMLEDLQEKMDEVSDGIDDGSYENTSSGGAASGGAASGSAAGSGGSSSTSRKATDSSQKNAGNSKNGDSSSTNETEGEKDQRNETEGEDDQKNETEGETEAGKTDLSLIKSRLTRKTEDLRTAFTNLSGLIQKMNEDETTDGEESEADSQDTENPAGTTENSKTKDEIQVLLEAAEEAAASARNALAQAEPESAVKKNSADGSTEGSEQLAAAGQTLQQAQTAAADAASLLQTAQQVWESVWNAYSPVLETVKTTLAGTGMTTYAQYADDAADTAQNVKTAYESAAEKYQEAVSLYSQAASAYAESSGETSADIENDDSVSDGVVTAYETALKAFETVVSYYRDESTDDAGESKAEEGTDDEESSKAKEVSTDLIREISESLGSVSTLESEWEGLFDEYQTALSEEEQIVPSAESNGTAGSSDTSGSTGETKPSGNTQETKTGAGTSDTTPDGGTSQGTDAAGGSGTPSGTNAAGGSGAPSGTNTAGGSGAPSGTNAAGGTGTPSGTNAAGGSGTPSGMSAAAGSGSFSGDGGSGTVAGGSGAAAADGSQASAAGEMAGELMAEKDTTDSSLFGDTYDLSRAESMLELEPSDTDDAKELLESLEGMYRTVQSQYDELLREEEKTRLEIDYTYNGTILDEKLAKVSYSIQMEEENQTLQEAEETLETLKEGKEKLESLKDGVWTSDEDATVAELFCEAGDILTQNALLSFYVSDQALIDTEVTQYEIESIHVGDEVDVTLSGAWNIQGTVSDREITPSEDTSRTDVRYQIEISIDNQDGRITSGQSAAIHIEDDQDT